MRLKSYFAGTVETAMALARGELGPDAMLVQSKKTGADTQHLGNYEVVFALEDDAPAGGPDPVPVQATAAFAKPAEGDIEKLSAELEDLKRKIERMAGGMPPAPQSSAKPDRGDGYRRRLAEAELDEKAVQTVLAKTGVYARVADPLRAAVAASVRADATLGRAGAACRAVALVGAPGAGKTSTLVKLAARFGLSTRRSAMLISTDVFRVGAAEQLRLYASILGIGFQAAESPLVLAQLLEEHRNKELILIDTPGWTQREQKEISEFASYIAGEPAIDVHLVLPVSHRAAALDRMVERYSAYAPTKLLFTRIDEADRLGSILNQCCRTGKPVSFLSGGEQIPEDLEAATPARVSELILRPQAADASAAVRTEVHDVARV